MARGASLIFAVTVLCFATSGYAYIPDENYSVELRGFLEDVKYVILSRKNNIRTLRWSDILDAFDNNPNAPMYKYDKYDIGKIISKLDRRNVKINGNKLSYIDRFIFKIETSNGARCVDGHVIGLDIWKRPINVYYHMDEPNYTILPGRCSRDYSDGVDGAR